MQATLPNCPLDRSARALSSRSLKALTDALPALYAETSLSELPRALAETLAKLLPGESHGVVVHDRELDKRYWHQRPASVDHEALVPIFFANFHEFAPTDHRRLTGTGAALVLSDFTSRCDFDRLANYTDCYRPPRIEEDSSINVQRVDVVTCAAVLRRRRGFRPEERELMNALRPHFKQAWANAQCFARLASGSTAASLQSSEWTPEPLEVRFGLTPREAEVLIWVAQGKTNPEVGTILGIRPYTVRTHLERVFRKLGVETRHAAGLLAIEVLGLPRG